MKYANKTQFYNYAAQIFISTALPQRMNVIRGWDKQMFGPTLRFYLIITVSFINVDMRKSILQCRFTKIWTILSEKTL
jgi:hypothetical protein